MFDKRKEREKLMGRVLTDLASFPPNVSQNMGPQIYIPLGLWKNRNGPPFNIYVRACLCGCSLLISVGRVKMNICHSVSISQLLPIIAGSLDAPLKCASSDAAMVRGPGRGRGELKGACGWRQSVPSDAAGSPLTAPSASEMRMSPWSRRWILRVVVI